ncbi:unnamed protein product [Amaranthus hypochondriacus]
MQTEEILHSMSNTRSTDEETYLPLLSSLIQNSLPNPFTEFELISLTKENEKEILISLSQILIQIRRWTDEEQRSYEFRTEANDYLNKIVANLIVLLNARNQYICHTAGKIFLAISEFLLAYGDIWGRFIHLLCVCFMFAMGTILQHSPKSLIMEADVSKSILSNLILISYTSTWNGIAGIIQVLRGIVKHLKDEDDAFVGVLVNNLSNCLEKVSWDLVTGIDCDYSAKLGGPLVEAEAKILFFGNFVQLLCSVVGLIGVAQGVGSHRESAILSNVCKLIPRLLDWCICEEWNHILPYFRHKVLMLMVKLSFHIKLGCSLLSDWLQLLHEYYQDLLSCPISQLEIGQNNTLEGSPFLLCLEDQDVYHLASGHLQRKAVFLFLRCSLSLISIRNNDDVKCTCAWPTSSIDSTLVMAKDCFAEKKGLLQFHEWVQVQVHTPSNMCLENEIDLEKCIKFASSFIRFYMQEDDMLFEVLLQMFIIPSWAERLFSKQDRTCRETDEDILFHVSNLFNPLLLFHVFLAELQYDHQLLLDYLISKDIGGKCAEYLLKCLRNVCNSWELFVEYSTRKFLICQNGCQRSCKRRRTCSDDSFDECTDTSLQIQNVLSSEKQRDCKLEGEFLGIRCLPFESVKACLVSLKSALGKLYRRNLFPYNPEVLIRRLTRFEELCELV